MYANRTWLLLARARLPRCNERLGRAAPSASMSLVLPPKNTARYHRSDTQGMRCDLLSRFKEVYVLGRRVMRLNSERRDKTVLMAARSCNDARP